jgi:RNA polymerase sigma-B factor
LRFVDNLTQSQIAEKVGLSQMHISRLIIRALDTIREQLNTG